MVIGVKHSLHTRLRTGQGVYGQDIAMFLKLLTRVYSLVFEFMKELSFVLRWWGWTETSSNFTYFRAHDFGEHNMRLRTGQKTGKRSALLLEKII